MIMVFVTYTIKLGVAALAIWHNRHNTGQRTVWMMVMALGIAGLGIANSEFSTIIPEIPNWGIWSWILFNWTIAPKGHSWEIYRSLSVG